MGASAPPHCASQVSMPGNMILGHSASKSRLYRARLQALVDEAPRPGTPEVLKPPAEEGASTPQGAKTYPLPSNSASRKGSRMPTRQGSSASQRSSRPATGAQDSARREHPLEMTSKLKEAIAEVEGELDAIKT